MHEEKDRDVYDGLAFKCGSKNSTKIDFPFLYCSCRGIHCINRIIKFSFNFPGFITKRCAFSV